MSKHRKNLHIKPKNRSKYTSGQRKQPQKTPQMSREEQIHFNESFFVLNKERDLTDQEQVMMDAILANLKTKIETLEPWQLRQWVNAVCDLIQYEMEWHFWDQAEDFFTQEQFEALPWLEPAIIEPFYEACILETSSAYGLTLEPGWL